MLLLCYPYLGVTTFLLFLNDFFIFSIYSSNYIESGKKEAFEDGDGLSFGLVMKDLIFRPRYVTSN